MCEICMKLEEIGENHCDTWPLAVRASCPLLPNQCNARAGGFARTHGAAIFNICSALMMVIVTFMYTLRNADAAL